MLLQMRPCYATGSRNFAVHWNYYLSENPNPVAVELLSHHPNMINWYLLSGNPAAIHLLEANADKINWAKFSSNQHPDAIQLLEQHLLDKPICWSYLSENPAAISILEKNQDKIDWIWLSRNPAAFRLMSENPDKIRWPQVCDNTNPDILQLLEPELEKYMNREINWYALSSNPAALYILKEYPHKIDWCGLCKNPNPEAIAFLQYNLMCPPIHNPNPPKIDWSALSQNPSPRAIQLLERNPSFIDWDWLSTNPAAFRLLEENPTRVNWTMASLNKSMHLFLTF